MARVLAVSSFVARGSVGLRAIVPALHVLGHEVTAIPSIVLSNHLSYRNAARLDVPPATLTDMLTAIEQNGWLARTDAVLTGYLPSAAHVAAARAIVLAVRAVNPAALYVCDPVLGDDPGGLYIDPAAASETRSLLELADAATPNRFELAWLSGMQVGGAGDAVSAARGLPARSVLSTSIPGSDSEMLNILTTSSSADACAVRRRDWVPHGTGDLLAALYLGHGLRRGFGSEAMTHAAAAVDSVLSAGPAPMYELDMAAAGPAIRAAQPLTAVSLG